MNDYLLCGGERGKKDSVSVRFAAVRLTAVLSLFLIFAACQHSRMKNPGELVFQPLAFPFPKAEEVKLSCGMELYFLEDHELPLFSLVAFVRTGSVYEPADKAGLASLTGTVMRTGGTRTLSGDEINEQLEFIAGSLETGIGREAGTATLSVLKKDIDTGLAIFAEVLQHPVFSQEMVDLARKKEIEAIRRRNDSPQGIAFREFRKALFNDGPRGRVPTVKTISSISRDDMISFYRQYFHPNNIIVGISGDFDRGAVVEKLESLFKDWEPRETAFAPLSLPGERKGNSVYYAYRNLPQSTIVMGSLAIAKNHPDYFPFTVLNFIVGGGGFKSRLTSDIRSNRGLAYSVGSIYNPATDYGIFAAYCFTKSASTLQCITLISDILKEVKKGGISPEELEWAKKSIINNFIFEFTTPFQVVNKQVSVVYDKLPQDFLQTYRERILAVTVDDVNRVAARYLHPDRMVLMVVGNGDDFDGSLSQLGTVRTISLEETL